MKLYVIGIGAGDPEHVTIQAVNALNRTDVVFALEKGSDADDLVRLREEICARYVTRPQRFVRIPDPPRDRATPEYGRAVAEWHEARAAALEAALQAELTPDGTGAILVWGDPSLYDGTLRVVDLILARGTVAFEHEVIPGITSLQALAARHRIPLHRVGGAVHVTTGRRLALHLPEEADDIAVMLDGQSAYHAAPGLDIYWGAYVGMPQEVLIAGPLPGVAPRIDAARAEARARHGWIMDAYILRRRT